ncbi:hypothetical protein [Saccharothrix coeruleofusca]|uniref:Uncharacterized protein n=1 Tax=Saccharothrix coeruleofusca TaxID=33919 RepID=A0A918ATU2_9PSEU|nr:hypothetical protein [Saccharothrix coeruleofusca]MBP2335738.1 zinc transporter ZupT [Saccharothrix coeruleofusca]GGP75463.1 hypothetical protein GCM10010185_56440 [Saccharothrix coeruleofusca]
MVTTTKTSPPATIIAAFFGFLFSTVTAFAGVAFLLGARQELVDAVRTANPEMTAEQAEQATTVTMAFSAGVMVLVGLVYLWLSFKLKAGRNWARVVLTVITLLQLAAVLTDQGTTAFGYVSCAIAVAALVLSYLPASNTYIAEVKRSG